MLCILTTVAFCFGESVLSDSDRDLAAAEDTFKVFVLVFVTFAFGSIEAFAFVVVAFLVPFVADGLEATSAAAPAKRADLRVDIFVCLIWLQIQI